MLVRIEDTFTPEEWGLHEEIRRLREAYEKAAKPYIDRLTAIQMRKLPKYVFMPDLEAKP